MKAKLIAKVYPSAWFFGDHNELTYLPFRANEGAVLFRLIGNLHCRTNLNNNLSKSGWSRIFDDPLMTAALLDRVTHRCDVIFRYRVLRLQAASRTETADRVPYPRRALPPATAPKQSSCRYRLPIAWVTGAVDSRRAPGRRAGRGNSHFRRTTNSHVEVKPLVRVARSG
jgi:hypothetical protein